MLIAQLYHKWDQNPVIVSFSTSATTITDIPFPAFTICNMNNVRKTVAHRILKNRAFTQIEKQERVLLEDLCSVDATPPPTPPPPTGDEPVSTTPPPPPTPALRIKTNWKTIQKFMVMATQPCHELLVACAWQSANRNCTNLFNTALTDEGLCCAFNKVPRDLLFRNPRDLSDLNVTFPFQAVDWTPENGYPSGMEPETLPWRPMGAGKHLGLTIVVDTDINEYFCSSTASVGMKMLMHSPVETPKLSFFGFAIRPGTENFITIHPQVRRSSPRISKIALRKRHCYFSFERSLRYYRTYTQHNCMQECEANYTLSLCSCVLYHMPTLMEVTMLSEDVSAQLGVNSSSTSCSCLPGCSEVQYNTKITSSALSNAFDISKRFAPLSDRKINVTHFMSMDEIFGFADFLGSTGGLLGLFLGFSILSAVEVIYFLSLRLICSLNHSRNSVSPPASAAPSPLIFVH
ncbi:hypothetical protein B566_EDAN001990 [Ephemera danica]|nr:hypothetical protein B566_EDAN001990 [Ephemera danica]